MINPDFQRLQQELKKRHEFPYRWFRKQNDRWDALSNFIYQTETWEELQNLIVNISKIEQLSKTEFFQYAINRWYNFHSAKAVESIFKNSDSVHSVFNKKDREKDFYINGIPFDHKTSVFPKGFKHDIDYAQKNKDELISWFYQNQSSQKRFHLKNRLFVVVYNENGEHWKLKAELWLLKMEIEKYLNSFSPEQLKTIVLPNATPKSDIIWIRGNLY